ncbi:hypothetical protein S83_066836, partial [Arachis hypogaea]
LMFGGNFAYVIKDVSLSLKQLILEIMASRMVTSDLSYNFLEGAIPESLGELTSLQRLNLNGNRLSGSVPASLGGRLLHRASF